MRRERFGTSAVQVNAGDVLLDELRSFDSKVWICRADLVDEVWLFDGMCAEYGFRVAVVRDDARLS